MPKRRGGNPDKGVSFSVAREVASMIYAAGESDNMFQNLNFSYLGTRIRYTQTVNYSKK